MRHFSRPLLPIVTMTLALAAATLPPIHPASAETTLAATATSVPQSLAPAQWCRPIVNAAINPAPLTCWLTIAATEPGSPPATLTGMNLGDLPPWGDIDIEAIGAELDRYIQQVADEQAEAERLATQAATKAGPTRRTPTTRPTAGGSTSGSGSSYDELYQRCFTLGQFAACSALFDHLEAGGGTAGGGGGGSSSARESEADRQAAVNAQLEAEIDGHIAILAAGIARNWDAAAAARARIAEQGANSASWDFYGWADPRTFGRVAADGRHIDHHEFYRFVGSACPGRWSGNSPIGLFLKPYEPMTLYVTCG